MFSLLCALMIANVPIPSPSPELKLHLTLPGKKPETGLLEEAWDYYRSNAFQLCASRLDRLLMDSKRHSLAIPPARRAAIAIMYERCAVEIDESGASEAALPMLQTALRLAPHSYSICFHQGLILQHGGYVEEARKALEKAISLAREENRLTGEILGNALEQEGPEEIEAAAKEALAGI